MDACNCKSKTLFTCKVKYFPKSSLSMMTLSRTEVAHKADRGLIVLQAASIITTKGNNKMGIRRTNLYVDDQQERMS